MPTTTPQQPKRNRRPKLKKVNVSARDHWKKILKEVDKDDIPIDFLLGISVNLIDGTQVNIDVRELLDQGLEPNTVKTMLDTRFKALDEIIKDIDFLISIDQVAETIQPITDQILKDL